MFLVPELISYARVHEKEQQPEDNLNSMVPSQRGRVCEFESRSEGRVQTKTDVHVVTTARKAKRAKVHEGDPVVSRYRPRATTCNSTPTQGVKELKEHPAPHVQPKPAKHLHEEDREDPKL